MDPSDRGREGLSRNPWCASTRAKSGSYHGAAALDITIRSAPREGRPFAPDRWDMVLGAKRGRLSQDAYRSYYLDLMRASYRQHREAWADLLARDEGDSPLLLRTHGVLLPP